MQRLPFIPDQIYNRRADIHARYGGNWQSGICPSSTYPYIFIFSGKSGKQHGYQDGWDNPNVFSYTGEGQSGDMEFTRGNLALKDHLLNGKRVFLFESEEKGFVRFISEVECFDVDYFETHDTLGKTRIGIKFFFKRIGVSLPLIPNKTRQVSEPPLLVDYAVTPPNETERKGLVTSRVGQGAYRKRIIHRWEYQCAVTGFDKLDVLIASHIVPWSKSNDNERLDVHNGLLLSPTYDALFDRHLISFENNGKIILSNAIELQAYEKIGVHGTEKINKLSPFNLGYLDRHRDQFNENS
ncbi:MAG: HNH endonuclease [Altibacter sp.]|uniref:HNH endonuclease n=1 Tax=Altibacter sp. TaxID=2024823 RepID=UPI001D9F0E3A|nr:HNH endonuclease [Altibacter sp.]MBZ0326802.1 HNH endonuclease [Altibacter sp.]